MRGIDEEANQRTFMEDLLMDGRISGQQLTSMITSNAIEMIYCITSDWHGQPYGKAVNGSDFLQVLSREGQFTMSFPEGIFAVDMDQNAAPKLREFGGYSSGFRDGLLVPDMSTIRIATWLPKTAVVICDFTDLAGRPLEVEPRRLLKKSIADLAAQSLTLLCASELEFVLMDRLVPGADGRRSAPPAGYEYQSPYTALQYSRDAEFFATVSAHLTTLGLHVKSYGPELGLRQKEINLQHVDPLRMADEHLLFKWAVKSIANQLGRTASFMAKYDSSQPGNSFHLHLSLWSTLDEQSVWAAEGESPNAALQQALAGLCTTTPGLLLMYAPTPNSYRRYTHGSFAPTTISSGWDNRTCAFRLIRQGGVVRIENRLAGADANPYLVISASIFSILHGLGATADPLQLVYGSAYDQPQLLQLDRQMRAAIETSRLDATAADILGSKAHHYMLARAEVEEAAFRDQGVTEWETRRYFERS